MRWYGLDLSGFGWEPVEALVNVVMNVYVDSIKLGNSSVGGRVEAPQEELSSMELVS
jgi:hypothetical protein